MESLLGIVVFEGRKKEICWSKREGRLMDFIGQLAAQE
jgi:hypothetical protein